MSNSYLHILIIWSSVIDKKDYIINDLLSMFHVIRIFEVHWEEDKFFDNYRTFYAHSLKHLNYSVFARVLNTKIRHCGTGKFIVIVFEDPTPDLHERETSSGKRLVNIRVFDKKTQYRKITGGGHKIHSSDDEWETNKDLTLLFGKNIEDFRKTYLGYSTDVESYEHNCVGVGGYDNIEQLFYVLNNTIKYCVLRNFESLPKEYTVEGHGDIDLLVEDCKYMRYLTFAKPVFSESYRVYHTIRIASTDIPFDFRHIGDNYYDMLWEEHILKHRQLEKSLFYVPNKEDLYYSLLYHAYIQKREVRPDYFPKLTSFGKMIGVIFTPDVSSCVSQLDTFMEKEGYEYTRPIDISVVYNKAHISLSKYATRFGDFVKRTVEDGKNGYEYSTTVYKKKDCYVKRGTPWLLRNEESFLNLLQSYPYFPKVLFFNESDNIATLEQTKIDGTEFRIYFVDIKHQTKRHVKSFLKQMLLILKTLNEHQVCHRDVLAENIIVNEVDGKSQVGLIDFGWAVLTTTTDPKTPKHLGGNYKPPKGYSDVYTFAQLIVEYWLDVPFVRFLASKLLSTEIGNPESERKTINSALQYLRFAPFTPYDELRLFLRRHHRPRMMLDSLKSKYSRK